MEFSLPNAEAGWTFDKHPERLTTMNRFPVFESCFLNEICRAATKRTKSMSHRGSMAVSASVIDSIEWLVLEFEPFVGPYVILQVIDTKEINLYIRSHRRHNRGKVLIALQQWAVIASGAGVVEAFEATLDHAHDLNDGNSDPSISVLIHQVWRSISLRLAAPFEPS